MNEARHEQNIEIPQEEPTSLEKAKQLNPRLFEFLKKQDIFSEEDGRLAVNFQALASQRLPYQNSRKDDRSKFTSLEVILYLSDLKGVVYPSAEDQADFKKEERPVMVLPHSLEEIKNGEYAKKALSAMLQPWEMGERFMQWKTPVVLKDNNPVNFAELATAKSLAKLKSKRTSQGVLEIFDETAGKYVKFSGESFFRLTGLRLGGMGKGIDFNPLKYAKENLKNLFNLGLIKESDFRTVVNSETSRLYNVHERRTTPKNPHAAFTNSSGQGANYYIGRKDVLVKQIDPDLAAIIEENGDGFKITEVLSLASGEEMEKVRNNAAAKLRQRGQPITEKNLYLNTRFGKSYYSKHARGYHITDFLPPRQNEQPAEYFKRIAPLADPEFTLEKTQKFFQDSGVPVHSLPWSEQLVLSRAFLEGVDENRLADFAKKYGLVGVRTFLSLDYDRGLGNRILDIGESLEHGLAAELFSKYGEIADAAKTSGEYLRGHFQGNFSDSEKNIQKVSENMLKKGKDLLVEFSSTKSLSQLSAVELAAKLQGLKTEVMVFAQAFKAMPREAKLNFNEVASTEIKDQDSSMLSFEEKLQMQEIFTLNREQKYPENLKNQTADEFKRTLSEPGHIFRILKHEGKIIAFLHFDTIGTNEIYVGSLNLNPAAKGSPIAETFLTAALKEKGAINKIKAVVWKGNPVSRWYGMLGFKKVGEIANYHNTGETYWELERQPAAQGESSGLEKAA